MTLFPLFWAVLTGAASILVRYAFFYLLAIVFGFSAALTEKVFAVTVKKERFKQLSELLEPFSWFVAGIFFYWMFIQWLTF